MTSAPAGARGTRRRVLRVSVALLIALTVGALLWLGIRGALAKQQLDAVAPLLTDARQEIADADLPALRETVAAIGGHAESARGLLGDPLWAGTEAVPFIGGDVAAVRTAVAQAAEISAAALPALDALGSAAPDRGLPGAVETMDAAASPLASLAEAVADAQQALDAAPEPTLDPVADAVDDLRGFLNRSAPTIAQAADATAVVPALLGAHDERNLLVVLQNPAEARTGGGITGYFLLFTADGGRLHLRAEADSADFDEPPADMPEIPQELVDLYGDTVATRVQNTAMTTDFPLTAQLASAWWGTQSDVEPDVVLSIDPLVLAPLLKLTGPLQVPGVGSVDAENLVPTLLRDPYRLEPEAQSDVQRSVTRVVLTDVLGSELDVKQLMDAVAAPLAQGRISLWSRDAAEQAILDDTAVGGSAARHRAAAEDTFVVSLNDTTGGKMDNYLRTTVDVGAAVCRPDGRAEVAVRVTLHNAVDPARVSDLSIWMTGGGVYGTPVGDIGTNVGVAAPEGWFYGGVFRDGEPVVSANAEEAGFPTSLAATRVSPGEDDTIEVRFVAPEPGEVAPAVLTSPLLNAAEVGDFTPPCR